MALVNAGLKPTRLEPPAEAAASLRARAVHANVEIAICAMADYFLGTQTSSFTLAITEERQAVFGHAAATGAEATGGRGADVEHLGAAGLGPAEGLGVGIDGPEIDAADSGFEHPIDLKV